MSTTTVDILDNDPPLTSPPSRSRSHSSFFNRSNNSSLSETEPVDLTEIPPHMASSSSSVSEPLYIDLTSDNFTTSLQSNRSKRKHESTLSNSNSTPSSIESLVTPPSDSLLPKHLRLNISRALHHRLFIIENRVLYPPTISSGGERKVEMEFVVQGPEGLTDFQTVKVGERVTCECEDCFLHEVVCRHILFILIKVSGLQPFDRS